MDADRARAARGAAGLRYDYAGELFSARRKDFWPLFRCRSLLEKFIPTLCHETDGLILQVGASARPRLPPACRRRSSIPRLLLLSNVPPPAGLRGCLQAWHLRGAAEVEVRAPEFRRLPAAVDCSRRAACAVKRSIPGAAAQALDTTRRADVGAWWQGRSCTCWRRGGTGRAA